MVKEFFNRLGLPFKVTGRGPRFRTYEFENEVRVTIRKQDESKWRIDHSSVVCSVANRSAEEEAKVKQKYKNMSPFTSRELISTLSGQVCSSLGVSNKQVELLLRRYINPKLPVSDSFVSRLKHEITKQKQGWFDHSSSLLESFKVLGNERGHFVGFVTISAQEMLRELVRAEKAKFNQALKLATSVEQKEKLKECSTDRQRELVHQPDSSVSYISHFFFIPSWVLLKKS